MVGIEMKKGYGVIYVMTCIPERKSYVGQAINYTSCNVKWSGERRVISHFREALKNNKEVHCRLLRDAIRKFGELNFLWCNLIEVPANELNYWERYFVDSLNTIHPHGYNVTKGGDHLNASPKHMKELIEGATQRALKTCPKYIFPVMEDTYVRGYYVEGYPNASGSTYPKENFTTKTHNCRNLKAAKQYIEHLETLNKDTIFDDTKYDVGQELKDTINKQTGLPQHIYRVNFKGKHIGYEIMNFKKTDGTAVYKKYNDSKYNYVLVVIFHFKC